MMTVLLICNFFREETVNSYGVNEFGNGYNGLKEGNFANPNLTWEKARKLNIGIDSSSL